MKSTILKALSEKTSFKLGQITGDYKAAIDTPKVSMLETFVFCINGVPVITYIYLQRDCFSGACNVLNARQCGDLPLLEKLKKIVRMYE